MTLQLELPFMAEDPDLKVNRAIERLQNQHERVRKSLYAKNSELIKITYSLQAEVEFLKRMLCNGEKSLV